MRGLDLENRDAIPYGHLPEKPSVRPVGTFFSTDLLVDPRIH